MLWIGDGGQGLGVEYVEVHVQPARVNAVAERPFAEFGDLTAAALANGSRIHACNSTVDELELARLLVVIGMTMAENHHALRSDDRIVLGESRQFRRAVSRQRRQLHVGRLAGWRQSRGEGVGMPIDEPQPGTAEARLKGCADAEEQGAVPAQHERSPTRLRVLREAVAQFLRRAKEAHEPDYAGIGVPLARFHAAPDIACILGLKSLEQTGDAQRGRRASLAA